MITPSPSSVTQDVDIKTISVWLGHANFAITHGTYAGWLGAEANADAVARLEAATRLANGDG